MRLNSSFRLVLATLLILLLSSAADAQRWKTPANRRAAYVALADQTGLKRAGAKAVAALNQTYGLQLTQDQVRIAPFTEGGNFWRFVGQAKADALGCAITPHKSGPHPHLLVGDHLFDGIQPGWTNNGVRARFQDGTMMRKDTFGRPHQGSSRLFLLYKAPPASVERVGAEANRVYSELRQVGHNCASFVTQRLLNEGRQSEASPFTRLQVSGSPPFAIQSLMRTSPDLVLEVLPDAVYRRVSNDPEHLVKFWLDQRLAH